MQLLLERHPYQVIRDAWSRAGASVASPVDQHAATADQVPPNSKFTEELDRRHQLVDLFWRYRHCRWYIPKRRYTQRVRWLMLKKNCVFSVQEDFPPPDCARPRGPFHCYERHVRTCISAYHAQHVRRIRLTREGEASGDITGAKPLRTPMPDVAICPVIPPPSPRGVKLSSGEFREEPPVGRLSSGL